MYRPLSIRRRATAREAVPIMRQCQGVPFAGDDSAFPNVFALVRFSSGIVPHAWILCLQFLILSSLPRIADGSPKDDGRSSLPTASQKKAAKVELEKWLKENNWIALSGHEKITSLLKQARDKQYAAPTRYVILEKAIETALLAGELSTALDIVPEVSMTFEIPEWSKKADVLEEASKPPYLRNERGYLRALALAQLELAQSRFRAIDPVNCLELLKKANKLSVLAKNSDPRITLSMVRGGLLLALEAAERDEFELALELAGGSPAHALRSDLKKELTTLQARFSKIKDLAQTLKTKPQDNEARLVMGKFYCFEMQEWDKGLKLLAAGLNQFTVAAEMDLKNPSTASQQMEAGDRWWHLADAQHAPGRTQE